MMFECKKICEKLNFRNVLYETIFPHFGTETYSIYMVVLEITLGEVGD